jgi:hypothetical protein
VDIYGNRVGGPVIPEISPLNQQPVFSGRQAADVEFRLSAQVAPVFVFAFDHIGISVILRLQIAGKPKPEAQVGVLGCDLQYTQMAQIPVPDDFGVQFRIVIADLRQINLDLFFGLEFIL